MGFHSAGSSQVPGVCFSLRECTAPRVLELASSAGVAGEASWWHPRHGVRVLQGKEAAPPRASGPTPLQWSLGSHAAPQALG